MLSDNSEVFAIIAFSGKTFGPYKPDTVRSMVFPDGSMIKLGNGPWMSLSEWMKNSSPAPIPASVKVQAIVPAPVPVTMPDDNKKSKYMQFCKECLAFNNIARNYNSAISAGNHDEAIDIAAKSTQPLAELAVKLDPENNPEIIEYCKNNNLPLPPETVKLLIPPSELLSSEQIALNALLEKYYEIEKSGSAEQKTLILRQAAALQKDPALLQTLQFCEAQWKNDIISSIRPAVENRDVKKLNEIKNTMISGNWSIPFSAEDINDLNNRIQQIFSAINEEKSQSLLKEIKKACDGKDPEKIAYALRSYHAFAAAESSDIDKKVLLQLDSARELMESLIAEKKIARRYHDALEKLKNSLGPDASVKVIDHYIDLIRSLDKDVPEDLLESAVSRKKQLERIAGRRKVISRISVAVFTLILIGGASFLGYFIVLRHIETRCKNQVLNELSSNGADSALKLLEDLKREKPVISRRTAIIELEKNLLSQKEKNDEQRKKFAAAVNDLLIKMDDFENNYQRLQNGIKGLESLTVDNDDRKKLQETVEIFNRKKQEYLSRNAEKFNTVYQQTEEQLEKFSSAMIDQDQSRAVDTLQKVRQFIEAMKSVKDLDEKDSARLKKMINKFAVMEQQNDALFEKIRQRDQLILNMKNTRTFQDYQFCIVELAEFPYIRNVFPQIGKSVKDSEAASKLHIGNYRNSLWEKDNARFAGIDAVRRKFLTTFVESLKTQIVDYEKNPRYTIIAGNDSRHCIMEFTAPAAVKKISDFTVHCENLLCKSDFEQNKSANVSFLYYPSKNTISIPDVSFAGTLIYPEKLAGNAAVSPPSPEHLQRLDLLKTLEKSDQSVDFEILVCNKLHSICRDRRLHPIQRYNMIVTILAMLENCAPDDVKKEYRELREFLIFLEDTKVHNVKLQLITEKLDYFAESIGQELQNFSKRSNASFKRMREYGFLKESVSRKVVPVGFFFRAPDLPRTIFRRFDQTREKGEIWLTDDSGKFFVCGKYDNEDFTLDADHGKLPEIKLVYSPDDDLNTEELKNFYTQSKISIPESWPGSADQF